MTLLRAADVEAILDRDRRRRAEEELQRALERQTLENHKDGFRQGYEDGMEAARQCLAAALAQLHDELRRLEKELESGVETLVETVLKDMVGVLPPEQVLAEAVAKALRDGDSADPAVLHVSSGEAPAARKALQDLGCGMEVEVVDVLRPGEFYLETRWGQINIGLQDQLLQIMNTLNGPNGAQA
jgi:flagellar biosynthesis/type III secretory pathway protein FliH